MVKDNVYVYSTEPGTANVDFTWRDTNPVKGKTSYYYVRGEQTNGELVWVSPMWITYTGQWWERGQYNTLTPSARPELYSFHDFSLYFLPCDKSDYRGVLTGLEGITGKKAVDSAALTVRN